MKYLIYLVFAITLVSCSSIKVDEGKNILWEVKSEKNIVYLLGSIHMARPDFYPLPSALDSTYALSDYLVLEFDLNKANPMQIMMKAMYQDTMTLEKAINPELFAKIEKLLNDKSIPKTVYNKMKPWFVAMFIQVMGMQENGAEAAIGIDQYFLGKLDSTKMKIKELESFEDQLAIFDNFQNLDDYLETTLSAQQDSSDDINQLLDAYKNGDIVTLDKLIKKESEVQNQKELMKVLLDNRNDKMTAKVLEYLKDTKTYFVIAGAAHLIGENGIISQLKKNGNFKIKRL